MLRKLAKMALSNPPREDRPKTPVSKTIKRNLLRCVEHPPGISASKHRRHHLNRCSRTLLITAVRVNKSISKSLPAGRAMEPVSESPSTLRP